MRTRRENVYNLRINYMFDIKIKSGYIYIYIYEFNRAATDENIVCKIKNLIGRLNCRLYVTKEFLF